MSTPPNPVPYYRPRPRSIFGPLLLIAIGVVLLLGTMRVFSLSAFYIWMAHYWPLLLIFWGLVKLAEHLRATRNGQPTPRLGAGGIIFLVFFILFGMGASKTANWNWGNFQNNFDDSDLDWLNGNRYDFTDSFAQSAQGATEIKIVSAQGDVNVTPSDDNQVHVVMHKILRSDSQDNANKTSNSIHPQFTQQGGILLLDLTNGDSERVRFDMEIQLPRALAVTMSTRRGNLSVAQRDGRIDLSTDHGNLSAENIKGSVSLRLQNGDVNAKNIAGDVRVDGEVEDGTVSDIAGMLDFNAGYTGTVEFSHIAQQLRFKSVRTDLQIAKLPGEMTMGHGDIRAESAQGPIKLTTRSNEIHMEDVSGTVDVENRNGLVEIRPKSPLGAIDVSNVHGGIQLDLPEDSNFRMDAQATNGNIDVNDFSLNVDNRREDSTARGSVGKGGPDIRLRADKGTIQIRKQ